MSATPNGVHLVGSIPLADAEEVLRAVGGRLGGHVVRSTDGETAERSVWIKFQVELVGRHPQMEAVPVSRPDFEEGKSDPDALPLPLPEYRLRSGVQPSQLRFDDLGYAAAALESYATFQRLRDEGVLPAGLRFMVALPTPLAVVSAYIAPEAKADVERAYKDAMFREIDAILAVIPAADLSIQWDVCCEVAMWEEIGGRFTPWFSPMREGTLERIADVAAHVPDDVEMGFHLCYGDYGQQHFVQPADARILTEMANGITRAVDRPIAFLHLPVPQDRDDEAYFAPLRDLELKPETHLYLGLVHLTDGVDGGRRRIAAAKTAVAEFGIATECGFGRRDPATIGPLMDLHVELASAH